MLSFAYLALLLVLLLSISKAAQFGRNPLTSSASGNRRFQDSLDNDSSSPDRIPFETTLLGENDFPYRSSTFPATPSQEEYSYRYANQQQRSTNAAAPNTTPQISPLVKQASTGAIGLLFGLLIWRSLSAYEMADQFVNESFRIMAIIPVMALLLANITGFIVNLLKPLNFKNHLKVILALNVIREWVELVYNVVMLITTSGTAQIPREVYFGRFFMNCWWSLWCFSFSKSRWVLQTTLPSQYQQFQQQYQQQHSPPEVDEDLY
mmetsp:Transcript_1285/g.2082  ORF Transcript_1285/g.2082 Transcript_1285/m.2082 type:complete len:264 (+) Transcript_1285:81-872(+)